VDSAGLALLAELAARLRAAGAAPHIEGEPAGLSELRTAYRLTSGLDFPGTPTP
jgi:phospholipid transport system transporter-binding protein